MSLAKTLRATPGSKFRLSHRDPAATPGVKDKKVAADRTAKHIARIDALQYRLYAENRRALPVVLQGIDASGKDGTIRHVMTGLNPQGCVRSIPARAEGGRGGVLPDACPGHSSQRRSAITSPTCRPLSSTRSCPGPAWCLERVWSRTNGGGASTTP